MSLIKPVSKSVWKYTSKAEDVWRGLNGIFAVYKEAGSSWNYAERNLKYFLCKDLNEMKTRPCGTYTAIEGETNRRMRVVSKLNYADHELVVGPRYQDEDLRMLAINPLTSNMSGIMLFGINRGIKMGSRLQKLNPIKFYKLKGILGHATDTSFITGKIVEKSTFKFIKRHHVDMVCATIQSSHQKKMFEFCGVDIQSQAAYDLAVQGPLMTYDKNIPMLYSIKCIDFDSPEFTLEIACINEDEEFLKTLVNGLGLQLRSTATCTQIQCVQFGLFNLDIALLRRDWNLECIVKNMTTMRYLIWKNNALFRKDPVLREYMNDCS
ncbi:hypothetical protein PV327_005692 [Microctonus hyperodae]|uniref:Pseudouridine synthase II N-terminal domain-containing protein n=1 Tax=Microctonus hyperodae TaxID=165561 RepID=A0AA39G2Q8_MICHY|nr:hypothetical protein PV327_005692 [Microctonus hyperodae]